MTIEYQHTYHYNTYISSNYQLWMANNNKRREMKRYLMWQVVNCEINHSTVFSLLSTVCSNGLLVIVCSEFICLDYSLLKESETDLGTCRRRIEDSNEALGGWRFWWFDNHFSSYSKTVSLLCCQLMHIIITTHDKTTQSTNSLDLVSGVGIVVFYYIA